MSSQKGNVKRNRGQKYQNTTVFINTKYDTSKRTQQINSTEVAEVCRRCQDVITWKIKYKKYKLLTQPKTCTKCHQKKIKDAYHTVCIDCSQKLNICCKCGKKEEIVAHKSPTETERLKAVAQLEAEIKALSERKRRAYYRYMDKLKGKKKKKRKPLTSDGSHQENQEENVTDTSINKPSEDPQPEEPEISFEDYFKTARQKLEELKKKMDEDLLDDFDELGICESSDESWEDDEEGDSDDDDTE